MYKEPTGDTILASCFREVNGEAKSYVYAATHLTKALAFAFSYHDDEVVFNSGIENSPNEVVMLCGGQSTLDKPRHIRVFGFPDEGFQEIPKARQAVSENPVPFSRARNVMETTDIDDLMKQGLQFFMLPEKISAYVDDAGDSIMREKFLSKAKTMGEALANIVSDLGARWINQERNIGVCPVLLADMPRLEQNNAITTPSLSPATPR